MTELSIPEIQKAAAKEGRALVSFEVFPPKGDLPLETAHAIASELAPLSPDFISVTYSAAGSGNKEATTQVASAIQEAHGIPVMAHLTCMGATRQDVMDRISEYRENGIGNVLALRGDPIPDCPPSEFPYAKDLIGLLKSEGLSVGAAAYPEGHVSCLDLDEDIRHMREKQDAGADFFVTQLFFDNEHFHRFRDRAEKAGINVPIFAGIMPFLGKSQIERMIFACGASLPAQIVKILSMYSDDEDSLRRAGIEYAAEQLSDLVESGVDGVHIYTMNRPEITKGIVETIRAGNPKRLSGATR